MITFHFLRPYYLIALIPLGFILWKILQRRWYGEVWSEVCDPHLLPKILLNEPLQKNQVPIFLLSFAWFLAVLAIAGPSWTQKTTQMFRTDAAQVIVVDLSPSMYARDVKPNRLERAKFKILDFLKHSREGQIGMVAFSREAYLVSPLTEDADTIAAMVPELSPAIMPTLGNNISSGIEKAKTLLKQAGFGRGRILLVTDSEPSAYSFTLAKQLKQQGIVLTILGIGTKQGAPIPTEGGYLKDETGAIITARLPSSELKRLAKVGGGEYVAFTNDNSDIDSLRNVSRQNAQRHEQQSNLTVLWQDQGRYLVWMLLPLALLAFRRGWFESILNE